MRHEMYIYLSDGRVKIERIRSLDILLREAFKDGDLRITAMRRAVQRGWIKDGVSVKDCEVVR